MEDKKFEATKRKRVLYLIQDAMSDSTATLEDTYVFSAAFIDIYKEYIAKKEVSNEQ